MLAAEIATNWVSGSATTAVAVRVVLRSIAISPKYSPGFITRNTWLPRVNVTAPEMM